MADVRDKNELNARAEVRWQLVSAMIREHQDPTTIVKSAKEYEEFIFAVDDNKDGAAE